MFLRKTNKWRTKQAENLFKALLILRTPNEVASFCRDLLTEAEIEEFSGRFAVAQELEEGKSQRAAAKNTGVSIATVSRVNLWLTRGMGGYKLAIERLSNKHHHHKNGISVL